MSIYSGISAEDVCKKHLKAPDMINSVYFSFYFLFYILIVVYGIQYMYIVFLNIVYVQSLQK